MDNYVCKHHDLPLMLSFTKILLQSFVVKSQIKALYCHCSICFTYCILLYYGATLCRTLYLIPTRFVHVGTCIHTFLHLWVFMNLIHFCLTLLLTQHSFVQIVWCVSYTCMPKWWKRAQQQDLWSCYNQQVWFWSSSMFNF